LNVGQTLVDTFTYTMQDAAGAPSSTTLTVTIDGANDAPVVVAGVANVSENLLSGGLPAASGDTFPQQKVSTGNLTITDPDNASFTIDLTAPATPLTSGGQTVTWTGGTGGTDLVGLAAGSVEVLRVHMDNTGAYTVTLSGPIDHPTGAGANILPLGVGVSVSDGLATTNSTLTVNIEDSVPVLNSPHQVVTLPAQSTNLLIVLDISGSMTNIVTVNGSTMTRLAAAEQAINTLLDTYAGMGSVMVRLVTFSTTAAAHGSVWETVATAKSYLASLTASGGTNYDAALATAETAFANTGKIAGAQNVSYFLTDGLPTYGAGSTSTLTGTRDGSGYDQSGSDTGIQSAEESNWTGFLATNSINSYAFGMGGPYNSANSYDGLTHTSQYYIDPIAYNGVTSSNTNGVVVTDWGQLASQLQSTVSYTATGSLLAGSITSTGSGVGADGGYIHYVVVDGVTYTYDPAAHSIVASNGSTPPWSNDTLTLSTSHGGTLIVDMATGGYTYNAPATLTTSGYYSENIGAQLIDKDGDVATGTMYLDVARAMGGAGNDTLTGTSGNDMIIGGPGNDTMTGGSGADTFRWALGDQGTTTTPAHDTITDFGTSGNDVLDLRDLLQGELHTGTAAGNLSSYLSFSYNSGTNQTTINVSSHASGVDQIITVNGDLVGAGSPSADQIIQGLLTSGKLITD